MRFLSKALVLSSVVAISLFARPGDGGTEKLTVEGSKLSNDINTKNVQITAKENSRVQMGISARGKDITIKGSTITNKVNMQNTKINAEKNSEVSAGVDLGN